MLKLSFYFCLFLFFSFQIIAQDSKFSSSFRSPVDIPLILAGNFGELRNNHFHTGIDIKTNQREGLNIYAVEDGFVSRIRVSPWGYGYALYIDHPNGLTTVYAHLRNFEGEIKEVAFEQQKKNQGFSIDYYPTKDSLKVKKGQVIAKSGNTGGSSAPHLHFEIRETETEHPLNPLLFNFKIADTRAPEIRNVKVYGLTEKGYRVPNLSKKIRTNGGNSHYSVAENKITVPAKFVAENGGIGFAFDVIDRLNGAENICGIYRTFLIFEKDTIFSQKMEYVSFDNNRQINTHKDYEEYHKSRQHFHKTFKTDGNTLPIYPIQKGNGILNVEPGKTYSIKYVVQDSYQNTSEISFQLEVQGGEKTKKNEIYFNEKMLYPDSAFLSYDAHHYLVFPPGILYEPTPLLLKSEINKLDFGNDEIPLHETYKIMLSLPDKMDGEKSYIQRISKNGKRHSEASTYKDGWLTARTRFFGKFSVQTDTIPPVISAKNFTNNSFVGGKQLTWSIGDSQTGLKDYQLFIDGDWYLLEYEPKKSSFFFQPLKELKGRKTVKIRATDYVGNMAEKEFLLSF